jgi:hypothetical protein
MALTREIARSAETGAFRAYSAAPVEWIARLSEITWDSSLDAVISSVSALPSRSSRLSCASPLVVMKDIE